MRFLSTSSFYMMRIHLAKLEIILEMPETWNLTFCDLFFCSLKLIFFLNLELMSSKITTYKQAIQSYPAIFTQLPATASNCYAHCCLLMAFHFYLPQMLKMGFRKFVKKMNLHTNTIIYICDSFLGNWLQLVVLETCH